VVLEGLLPMALLHIAGIENRRSQIVQFEILARLNVEGKTPLL